MSQTWPRDSGSHRFRPLCTRITDREVMSEQFRKSSATTILERLNFTVTLFAMDGLEPKRSTGAEKAKDLRYYECSLLFKTGQLQAD